LHRTDEWLRIAIPGTLWPAEAGSGSAIATSRSSIEHGEADGSRAVEVVVESGLDVGVEAGATVVVVVGTAAA
jgi:hypothetical protein